MTIPACPPTLTWPPREKEEARLNLVRTDNETLLPADRATVHAYVTNASRWHEWHPATRSVEPLPDRPLGLGETVVEHIAAAGRRFTATWTVLAVDAPHLWVIATDSPQGLARITYRLAELAAVDGQPRTRFHRRLECRSAAAPWRWLDPWVMLWVLAPQSRLALRGLQEVLEQGATPSPGLLRLSQADSVRIE